MPAGARRYAPNAGWPLARTGTRSNLRPAPNRLSQKRATGSRPSYSSGIGGIDTKTSSVSRATSASRSADSYALTNFATIASSAGEPEAGGGSPAAGGRLRSRLARARLSALVTDSTVESSRPATSLAWNPRTSRKMSTASWRGGSTCNAVMKAREMDSVCSYRASGPGGTPGTPSRRASGNGSSQTTSPSRVGSGGSTPGMFHSLAGGRQRVLEGVLGVLEGPQHPVAVHLQLPAVRLGQLPERVAIPGPRPCDQVGCHQHHPNLTFLRLLVPRTPW